MTEPKTAIHCGRCDQYWTGVTAAHCGSCHRIFTGITAFDMHRVGGVCTDPLTVTDKDGKHRMVAVERAHWLGYGLPGDGEQWWE